MMPFLLEYGFNFAATCIIEMLVLHSLGIQKLYRTNLLCNALTNPLLTTIMLLVMSFTEEKIIVYGTLFILEIAVVFAEAYIYRAVLDMDKKRSFKISIISNGVSFLFGVLLFVFLFWLKKEAEYVPVHMRDFWV